MEIIIYYYHFLGCMTRKILKEEAYSIVKCTHCEHLWITKSVLDYVSCSNCLKKTVNEEYRPHKIGVKK